MSNCFCFWIQILALCAVGAILMNIWHQATTSSGEHHQATRLDVALTIGSLLLIHFQITCTAMEVEFAWPEFSLGLLRWLSGLVYFNMGSLVAAECQGDAFNVFGMFVRRAQNRDLGKKGPPYL